MLDDILFDSSCKEHREALKDFEDIFVWSYQVNVGTLTLVSNGLNIVEEARLNK